MRHDFLNPAGVARMNTQMVLTSEKNPKKKGILKIIETSSDRMIKMIENASIFAKLESGEKLGLSWFFWTSRRYKICLYYVRCARG